MTRRCAPHTIGSVGNSPFSADLLIPIATAMLSSPYTDIPNANFEIDTSSGGSQNPESVVQGNCYLRAQCRDEF